MEIVKICPLEDGGGYREDGLGQRSPRGKATHLDTHLGSGGLSCCLCWVLGQLWRKGVEGHKKHFQKEKSSSMFGSFSLTSGMGSTQAHRLSPGSLNPHSAVDPLMSRNPYSLIARGISLLFPCEPHLLLKINRMLRPREVLEQEENAEGDGSACMRW